MKPVHKKIIYFILSLIVCFVVLRYVLSEISFGQVTELMLNADAAALIIFVILSLLMTLFRTWRYKLLLNFSGVRPNSFALYLVVLIRNFCSDLLPARTGSLVYVFLLNKRLGVSLDQATSSFSLAMVFDLCSVAPLVLVATLFLGDTGGVSNSVVVSAAVVFLILSTILIYMTPFLFKFAGEQTARIKFLPEKIRTEASKFFDRVNLDIRQIRDAGLYTKVFLLSILIRVFKYASLYFILYALLAPEGYTYAQLPWAKVFFGLIVPEFVVSLPISGIAGFGAYQSAWIFMFELLKFPSETAKITSLSHHILSQAFSFGIAIAAFLILLLPGFKARSRQQPVL